MKKRKWRLTLLAAFTGMTVFCGTIPAFAVEERDASAERLEPRLSQIAQHQEQFMHQVGDQMNRLDQRLNQIAERQEQLMRQVGSQMERMGATPQGGAQNLHQSRPPEGRPPAVRPMKAVHDLLGLFFICYMVCNILMAIWIFTDIRKRGEGPAIFVAVALVAGFPAALVYSLIRIGDKKASSP